jgi:hypothetical protein
MSFTSTTIVKKSEFEDYLYFINNEQTMGYTSLKENGATLHLYYNDYGHIGTWQAPGNAVVFEKIVHATSEDDFQLQGSKVYKKNGIILFKEHK